MKSINNNILLTPEKHHENYTQQHHSYWV